MAKKSYIGIDNVARKIKKWYIGVDNVAHKVRKAYIGVGGVARPFMSSELTYYGSSSDGISGDTTGVSTNKYAFFQFGDYSVSTYNPSLVYTTVPDLDVSGHSGSSGASIGEYALFGSLYYSSNYKKVRAYNSSLTRTTCGDFSKAPSANYCCGASNPEYAVFVHPYDSDYYFEISGYDSNLVKATDVDSSWNGAGEPAGTSLGNYALFAGYQGTASSNSGGTVLAVNSNFTYSYPCTIDQRESLASATVGNYALFAGGQTANATNKVNAIDKSLVCTTITSLVTSARRLTGISADGYALFGGGYSSEVSVSAYDENLVRTLPGNLSVGRYDMGGASVSGYAIFAGGIKTPVDTNTTDIYST